MKKSAIYVAFAALGFATISTNASAALASDATLDFTDGIFSCEAGGTYPDCTYNASNVATGSYFAMDISGNGAFENNERVAMVSAGTGLTLGTAQGKGAIDIPWSFAGATGVHYTLNGLVVSNAAGNTADVNMSGWTVFWNGGDIDMGQGAAAASVVCGTDCAVSDTFTLDYDATVPSGGFAGVMYTLHLEGTVAAPIPVPAAVWLFGSGLLGLVGVARRKKTQA